MAGRGAWRLDGGARRVETIAPSSPPPVLLGRRPTSPCNAPTLPIAPVPVGAALETPAASNLRAPTRPMARLPRGERKDALDTVALRRCRAQVVASIAAAAAAAASVGVKPRHHFRRRLRRATRCVGAFAAAPAQHARALRAIDPCCAGTSWPDLGVRAQLLRSARASRRAAKGAGKSMANGEMVGGSAVLAPGWSRPQRGGGRAHRAVAKKGE